jgi:His-Xaa-Ser system protein HxsD
VPRTLVFSALVYDIAAVKKAAYRFSDVLSVEITPHSDEIECVLHFVPHLKEEGQQDQIVAAFRNEVLDQDLRSIVAKETEAIRNAILAHALSKTGLQEGE